MLAVPQQQGNRDSLTIVARQEQRRHIRIYTCISGAELCDLKGNTSMQEGFIIKNKIAFATYDIRLAATSCRWSGSLGRRSVNATAHCNGLLARLFDLAGGGLAAAWAVPVVDHLCSQDGIKHKASDEAVQNQFVVDFLQGGEDAGKRSHEVVEDLCRPASALCHLCMKLE